MKKKKKKINKAEKNIKFLPFKKINLSSSDFIKSKKNKKNNGSKYF